MSKPSDFYVGVLNFFAILLPGAIATAILKPKLGLLIIGPLIAIPESEAGEWVMFLSCAYFLGHLIFLIGSYIDLLYNKIREKLSPYGNESAYQCATRIRNSLIDITEQEALNTFQWARSVLIAKCSVAAEDVHRLEADSKFFRSLVIVSALSGSIFLFDDRHIEAVAALLIIPLCFARYYERRLKSTTQAYIHVITLYRLGVLSSTARSDNA